MANWDRHLLKAEIYRRGETLTSLAQRFGVEPSAVRQVLAGRRWPRIEQLIADFVEMPVDHLFPLPDVPFPGRDSGTTRRRHARRGKRRATSASAHRARTKGKAALPARKTA